MQDFIRIGGPITSSPLNENFRRLLNAITIANVNLVFPEENEVVNTIDDMKEIDNPLDGQVCYVVSSGEFYRYSKGDSKWHKIMDIGQTFRQGFLNSGAVVLEGPITLKENTETTLIMPSMLVYFKNQEGDGRYLRGMYKIDRQELDLSSSISGGNAYSIFVDSTGLYTTNPGMPMTDNVNYVFIGTFLANKENKIIPECIYTLPDIAYTADRGQFLLNGGQASGLNLTNSTAKGNKVARREGYYYDEGINYSQGQVENFPADTDNGSNFDLKYLDGEDPVSKLIYITPTNGLNGDLTYVDGLIHNKYWDGAKLATVPDGYYTIQQHLVTPNGQNFIVYGDTLYNSMTDAVANVNSTFGLDIVFPYVEATRIVLGTQPGETFDTSAIEKCQFFTMGRLAQVGTISPEFADTLFRIYSGDAKDTTPSSMRFDLGKLQTENYNQLYSLGILPSQAVRTKFGLNKKYIKDGEVQNITATINELRSYGNVSGYELADQEDVADIIARLKDIETEIWNPKKDQADRYQQSIRYRLFTLEGRADEIDVALQDHLTRIEYLEKYKVHKNTTINGYKLGDNTNKDETKGIVLYTGDIDEGKGLGSTSNLWFTQARVSQNTDVVNSKTHMNTKSANDAAASHTKVNPHNLSTDDINLLSGTTKIFVTPEEERRIRSDKLPDDTKSELAKKLEDISIQTIEGDSTAPGASTTLGDVTALKFYKSGTNITVDTTNKVATIECVGQTDPNDFLLRKEFAISTTARPDLYGGAVDRALNADNVTALDDATAGQYYGTNAEGDKGVFDLPVYVSTTDASSYTDVDKVTFAPIDKSITLRHLADGMVTYTNGNEENELQTNVYDLVKHRYHKVFNSGSQGPYKEGTTTQDTSAIKYQYEIPSGGLQSHVYYFTYNNTSYKFTGATTMVAKTVLTYIPSTNKLSYKTPTGNDTALTITQVEGTAVEQNYWLPFVATTDWNKINEWNFGNNLTVTVSDGRATINASVAGNGATSFTNLSDTSVTYNEDNIGKMVVLGKDGSNNFKLQFAPAPALNNYMLIADYVDSTIDKKVKLATKADLATTATSANTLQTKYTVNDSGSSNTTLWTAAKIKSNTTAQIQAEGVNTYYGTTAPTTIAGSKEGDLYILIEN